MQILLKFLGSLTLIGLFLAGSAVIFVWLKLRRLAQTQPRPATPSRIELTPDPEPQWLEKEQAQRDLAALTACGYVRGPAYQVVGIPDVALVSLSHPDTGAFGCHYHHPQLAGWTDLCAVFTDGTELTVTSAAMGGELDQRPSTEKIRLPRRSPLELHAMLVKCIAGRTVRHHVPENFRADFCGAYARDMAWRNDREGLTEEEFRRYTAASGKHLSAAQLREAFLATKCRELDQWSEEILNTFLQQSRLPAAESKRYAGRLIICRDTFHPVAYLSHLTDTVDLTAAQAAAYESALLGGGLTPRSLLDRITADTGQRFVKLGEVDQPKRTEIYALATAGD